jgi:hypothetical protein
MVQLDIEYLGGIYLHVWLCNDDTAIIHQLQATKCRTFELEDNDLQEYQYIYR